MNEAILTCKSLSHLLLPSVASAHQCCSPCVPVLKVEPRGCGLLLVFLSGGGAISISSCDNKSTTCWGFSVRGTSSTESWLNDTIAWAGAMPKRASISALLLLTTEVTATSGALLVAGALLVGVVAFVC